MRSSLVGRRSQGALFAACVLSSCVDHAPLRPSPEWRSRLSVVAAAVQPGDQVMLTSLYLREPAIAVPIASHAFDVSAAGDHVFSLDVDLGLCQRDPQRARSGSDAEACLVLVDVVLRSASGLTCDSSRFGPVVTRAGAVVERSVNLYSAPLTVTGFTPDPAVRDLAVGDTIRVTFSEPTMPQRLRRHRWRSPGTASRSRY